MTADDGFVMHFRMRNGCVGVLQSTASDRGIVVETRVTGSTGTAWIEGVGDKVRVADAAGVRTMAVPDSLHSDPAPPLPEGAVTTTYEQMTTFGVEYGPYTRLAATFRDRIPGSTPPAPCRPRSSTAWPRWRCSTRRANRLVTAGSGSTSSRYRLRTSRLHRPSHDRPTRRALDQAGDDRVRERPRPTMYGHTMAVARLGGCGGGPVNRRGPPPRRDAGLRRPVTTIRCSKIVPVSTTDSDSFKFAAGS